ncbi:MAG: SMC-Scp complex subunit ScpB [Candidatus Woesearchaeota archaeon]
MNELKNKIEAILFASGKKLTYEEIARLCNCDISSVKKEIETLKKEYKERESPLMFSEESDGIKMTVREAYLSVIHNLVPETELGKSLLETLAVVAWKQPVMQSELIKIRTNKAYEDVAQLVEKGFISKEKHGRTFILKTTQKFNEYFDLPGREAIKKIFKEVEAEAELGEQRRVEDYIESQEEEKYEENNTKETFNNLEVYETDKIFVEEIRNDEENQELGEYHEKEKKIKKETDNLENNDK